MSSIKNNLAEVRNNIAITSKKKGRTAEDISLVCVTKQIPVESINEALDNGINIIGEARVSEALSKKEVLQKDIKWHLIGHLQSRKAKEAVKVFDLIHSIDTVKLAKEIDNRARAINKVQNILLEVNISEEESKYGFKPEYILSNINEIAALSNIKVQGLMTMAPLTEDENIIRPVFRGLKNLFDRIKDRNIAGIQMKYLSMGMSQDYIIAIEEGSNMVRIGSAIFF